MSKSFALAAFNAAVIATNAAHAAKRGVVAAASFTKDNAVAGTTASKEVGVAFWAGMKYGLNPFEIRAGLKPQWPSASARSASLNPFEIRAGLKPGRIWQRKLTDGLNPFEIRAGLKPPEAHRLGAGS